jgi:hypothetical protein
MFTANFRVAAKKGLGIKTFYITWYKGVIDPGQGCAISECALLLNINFMMQICQPN